MAAFLIKIHFAAFTNLPQFASKQTCARIDYLRQGGQLVDKKGTHNVKIYTENQTKTSLLHTRAWATAQKTPSLTTAARAVAKHAAHGQRRQHHANAEVIC